MGPAESLSSSTISQIEQSWLDFIYKALEQCATGSIFKIFDK